MKKYLPAIAGLLATTSALVGALAEANLQEGTLDYGSYNMRNIKLPPGFKLELIYGVPTNMVGGGWVSICADPKGRIFTSSRDGRTYRLTVPPPGAQGEVKAELVDLNVGRGDGLLWAFDSLYVVSEGTGLVRVQDLNKDDRFDANDSATVLRRIPVAGDHAVHSVELTPDGKSLFFVAGNSTPPTTFASSRVPLNWGEDTLLQRLNTGFMDTTYAPDGWIAITDPQGEKWELFASGFRNQYDAKLNNVGEMFTYDSDMEWDMGDPWYRPTRVDHVISGADFGFRNGSGKWPEYYVDRFGVITNIGRGSPVGNTFGYGAKFPKKWQDAFFFDDHQYGRIYAAHLTPSGSTYTAEVEVFMSAQPLNAADITVNPVDGAMYFVLGGRSSESSLWRITYGGPESTAPTTPDLRNQEQRDQRHKLEAFHGHTDPAAVATVWPFLGDQDRAMRYAARVALEWQNPAEWTEKALAETDMRKSIAAIVALARVTGQDEIFRNRNPAGVTASVMAAATAARADFNLATFTAPANPQSLRAANDKLAAAELAMAMARAGGSANAVALRARMLAALDRINYKTIPYADKLDLLRAYSLVFIRTGRPDDATIKRYVEKFDPLFPAETREENFELSEMLVYLQSPNAAAKLVKAMNDAPSKPYAPRVPLINPQTQNTPLDVLARQEEQVHYALHLRKLTTGWTLPLRQQYFSWFATTAPNYRGGNEFASSNAGILNEARNTLSPDELTALQPILASIPAGGGRGARGAGAGGGAAVIPGATGAQAAAINAMDQALADQIAAVAAARTALVAATFVQPANDTDLRTKNDQLRSAELALASARAEQFNRIQAGTNRLSTDQVNALILQGVGGRAGRGGGAGGGPAGGGPAGVPAGGG